MKNYYLGSGAHVRRDFGDEFSKELKHCSE
jgi:hypothetical protein